MNSCPSIEQLVQKAATAEQLVITAVVGLLKCEKATLLNDLYTTVMERAEKLGLDDGAKNLLECLLRAENLEEQDNQTSGKVQNSDEAPQQVEEPEIEMPNFD